MYQDRGLLYKEKLSLYTVHSKLKIKFDFLVVGFECERYVTLRYVRTSQEQAVVSGTNNSASTSCLLWLLFCFSYQKINSLYKIYISHLFEKGYKLLVASSHVLLYHQTSLFFNSCQVLILKITKIYTTNPILLSI